MLASAKCRELAFTLNTTVMNISFENVKIVADQILRCTANVLSVR